MLHSKSDVVRQYMARLINAFASLAEGETSSALLQREELGHTGVLFPLKMSVPPRFLGHDASSVCYCLSKVFCENCCHIAFIYVRAHLDSFGVYFVNLPVLFYKAFWFCNIATFYIAFKYITGNECIFYNFLLKAKYVKQLRQNKLSETKQTPINTAPFPSEDYDPLNQRI